MTGEVRLIEARCREYLEWGAVSVERLGKGCSNDIYLATNTTATNTTTNTTVLVRLYGDRLSSPLRLNHDIYVNCYLSARGGAPRILGLFEEGRIEEYIPSHNISTSGFREQYRDIFRRVAELHDLNMPLPREVFIRRYLLSTIEKVRVDQELWAGQVTWYLGVLDRLDATLHKSFTHNDINMNNILISESGMMIIDYEYSGYNYSLYDIANYCCELQYDWSVSSEPFFTFNEDRVPGDQELREMLQVYRELRGGDVTGSDDVTSSGDVTSADDVTSSDDLTVQVKQVKVLMLASELIWTLWALTLESGFNVEMDEYFQAKSTGYWNKKERFREEIEDLLCSAGAGGGSAGAGGAS